MATTRQDTYVRRSPRGLALRSGNLSRAPCAARPRALAWPSPVPREVPRLETTTDGSCRRPPACWRRMGVVPRPPGCVCVCVGVCGGVRKSVRRARRAWRSPLDTHAACRGWSHWGGHGEPRDPRTRRRRRRRGHLHCARHHGGRHGACPDSVLTCLVSTAQLALSAGTWGRDGTAALFFRPPCNGAAETIYLLWRRCLGSEPVSTHARPRGLWAWSGRLRTLYDVLCFWVSGWAVECQEAALPNGRC